MITQAKIPSLLLGDYLHSVFDNNNTWDQEWKHVYRTFTSDKAVEYEMEMQALPLAALKNDGAAISLADMQQGYESRYVMQYYGLGFVITRATILDNQYPAEFPKQAEYLRSSMATTKNINSMYLFNNGFSPGSTGSDGKPLFSLNHPVQGYNLANTFSVGTGLLEASLENAADIVAGYRSLSGLKINTVIKKLLVCQEQRWNASRIINTAKRTATGDNDISAIVHDNMFSEGLVVNHFLQNNQFWCLLTNEPNGFKYFEREPYEIDFQTDQLTKNTMVSAIERYAFGESNWRAGFASGIGLTPLT